MDFHYAPYTEAVRANPYPYYRELRAHHPVYWAEEPGAWVLSRHADVLHVLKNPQLYSSDAMGQMMMGERAEPLPVMASMPRIVILADPPVHAPLRNLVNRGSTPRRISALEPRLREIVAEAAGALRTGSGFDVIRDLAIPVPVTIISELLGVESSRMEDFKRWSDEIIAMSSGSGRKDGRIAEPDAMLEFREYFSRLIAERKAAPREDLVSVLTHAQEGEAALEHDEVVLFLLVLLVAGNETTTNLIGNAVQCLLAHPDVQERVRGDKRLIPALVEETLRCESPIQFLFRRVRRDVEVEGVKLREDDPLLVLIGSANRDERRFERSERFDIDRDTRGHLTFGFGNHFCLGASLARLEARISLEALVDELAYVRCQVPTKEHVLLELQRRLEISQVERMKALGPPSENVGEFCRQLVKASVDGLAEAEGLHREILAMWVRGQTGMELAAEPLILLAADYFADAAERGAVRSDITPERLAVLFLGALFTVFMGDSPAEGEQNEHADLMLEIVVRGLAP